MSSMMQKSIEALLIEDLKKFCQLTIKKLFSPLECKFSWTADDFPFTDPSFELNISKLSESVKDENNIEVLGCGLLKKEILNNFGRVNQLGWAVGLGLDRLTMLKFGIDDIRTLWTDSTQFFNQFDDYKQGQIFESKVILNKDFLGCFLSFL